MSIAKDQAREMLDTQRQNYDRKRGFAEKSLDQSEKDRQTKDTTYCYCLLVATVRQVGMDTITCGLFSSVDKKTI